jgi:hypothetical protein
MPRPQIRTLMVVVMATAIALATVPTVLAAWRDLHLHDTWITVGPFTIRF